MPGRTVSYARTEVRARVKGFLKATIEAAKLRFRAVMMTALSFILGVIQLLIATGAGSESQKVIGTAVFGGDDCGDVFESGGGADVVLCGADFGGEGGGGRG